MAALHYERAAAGLTLCCDVLPMGRDCTVCISSRPGGHAGSAAMAVSRPSLTGRGTSATTSILNRMGHKDDAVASHLAERLASALDCAVVCVCGIHGEGLTPEGISEILEVCRDLETEILRDLGMA